MVIDDLPVIKLNEPINPKGGHIEVDEEERIPRRFRLQDPLGNTSIAEIRGPRYSSGEGIACYSYFPIDDK